MRVMQKYSTSALDWIHTQVGSQKRVSFLEQDFLQDELRYEESKAKKK